MPLYELVAISRTGKEIVRPLLQQTAQSIMHRGGVVRSLNNMRQRTLPQRMKAHQAYHTQGHYLSVVFDAAPAALPPLQRQLQLDTRVIRATLIKLGDQLHEVSGLPANYLEAAMGDAGPRANAQSGRHRRLAVPVPPPHPGTEHEHLALDPEYQKQVAEARANFKAAAAAAKQAEQTEQARAAAEAPSNAK